MATPPPPPAPLPAPSGGGGGSNKILLGCGIGCGALLLLALIAGGVVYVKLVRPMVAQTQAVEKARQEAQAAREALDAIDEANPSSIGEDLDQAELAASDVDAYLGLRSALADQAAAAAAAKQRIAQSLDIGKLAAGGNPMAAFGMMRDMFASAAEHQRARGALLRAAADELEASSTGPTEFQRLIEIIEWRFLRRDEALVTALTPSERDEWMSNEFGARFARSILDSAGAKASASDRAQFERQLESAEERLDELREEAAGRTALSAATKAVLEARRAELQALPVAGLDELGTLSDDTNPMEWLSGLQGAGKFSP